MKITTTFSLLFIAICLTPSSAQSPFDKLEHFLKEKNFEVTYGPQDTWYKKSFITYVHPEYKRNLEFQSVYGYGNDDLDFLLKGEFGVPQYKIEFGIDLSEKYSLFIIASHLTYEVDVNKTYYRIGEWNGFPVSDSIYLRDDITKLEHSNGMNIWNVGVKRKIPIGFKGKENIDLNYTVTPNVGLVFTASQASIKNPANNIEHYNRHNSISGLNYAINSEIQLVFKKHFQFAINLNYFQMIILKAKLTGDAYLKHQLRGLNYGASIGYRF